MDIIGQTGNPHTDMTDTNTAQTLQEKRMITALALGEEVDELFLITAAQLGQSRNGPYWRLEFRDASGNISGKIWPPHSERYQELPTGTFVKARGRVSSYRDRLELIVESLYLLDEAECATLNPALFMAASEHDPEHMLEELLALAKKELTHKPWHKLVTSVLHDPGIGPRFRLAPAAKAMHHAYAGGLLEHTLSVTTLAMRIADNYPELDRQVLFAGAVFHDLGKLWELTSGPAIDYTSEGRLIGHISLVMERLSPFIKKAGLEPHLAEHLQHLILSHHGTHEFGSPRLPATAEALVLHYADNIDAKLQQVRSALDGVEPGGWSSYNPSLERFLFQPERTPAPEPKQPKGKPAASSAPAFSEPLPLFIPCSSPSKE